MTEIETSLPVQEPSSGLTTAIDDEAYLMTMVEADESLLPSNMTFSGLFEGDNELLNSDDLTGKLTKTGYDCLYTWWGSHSDTTLERN